MKTTHLARTLIVMLALEWEPSSGDPFIFCYRIMVEPVFIFLAHLPGKIQPSAVTEIHDRIG